LVLRWECEMLWPNPGPLPHTSQFAAIAHTPFTAAGAALSSQQSDTGSKFHRFVS
jgi:hypothetical protein